MATRVSTRVPEISEGAFLLVTVVVVFDGVDTGAETGAD
jgi:hypothetical protein